MKETETVTKCITIKKEQEEFLIDENNFKLSKFVQCKLDDYIKALNEYRQFTEVEDEKEI